MAAVILERSDKLRASLGLSKQDRQAKLSSGWSGLSALETICSWPGWDSGGRKTDLVPTWDRSDPVHVDRAQHYISKDLVPGGTSMAEKFFDMGKDRRGVVFPPCDAIDTAGAFCLNSEEQRVGHVHFSVNTHS